MSIPRVSDSLLTTQSPSYKSHHIQLSHCTGPLRGTISWTSKYDALYIRCLWCLRSKDQLHYCDIEPLDWQLGIINHSIVHDGSIQWTHSLMSTYPYTLVSPHKWLWDQSLLSNKHVFCALVYPDNKCHFLNYSSTINIYNYY